MRDLLIITPVRKRLFSAQRLIGAVTATATADTDLILAVDDDDDTYDGLTGLFEMVRGPRQTVPAWTNQIALEQAGNYRALASLGDDHVPITYGWDSMLLAASDKMGGTGISYGNDCLQGANLPTAPVISSNIVRALGWMMYPKCNHFYCDNVWKDLGMSAECLAYLSHVIIKHLHWSAGTADHDRTYAEADPSWSHDEYAYRAWTLAVNGLASSAEKIKALR